MLGYLCAYYRYYYPTEFITSFLNNAENDDDIVNGTKLAATYGVSITAPKFGVSLGDYACDSSKKQIAKGLSSIKYLGSKASAQLYDVSKSYTFTHFVDVLMAMKKNSILDARQIQILISIDFFSEFGNQRELEDIVSIFDMLKQGDAKQIRKETVDGWYLGDIIQKYAYGKTKSGNDSKSWTILDIQKILHECEDHIKSSNLNDYGTVSKVRRFNDAMGYSGFISGKEEDRPKLIVKSIFPVCRKKDGVQFAYNILTQSIGSGIESKFTIFNSRYNQDPIEGGDIIYCKRYRRDGAYYTMTDYYKIVTDDDEREER